MEKHHIPPTAVALQIAALCWRQQDDARQVLLITSRDTGRWIIPKGWPMKDRTPAEAAMQEAWEEAGVTGTAISDAIGSYSYDKMHVEALPQPCQVQVYPLQVERLDDRFPEAKQRRRKWFSAEKAARKVAEPELRALILRFAIGQTSATPSAASDAPSQIAARSAALTEAGPDSQVEGAPSCAKL